MIRPKVYLNMLESVNALVVQWIEQSRPKGLMWVRFLPRAQPCEIDLGT